MTHNTRELGRRDDAVAWRNGITLLEQALATL